MTTIEIYRYFSRLTMLVIAFTFILVPNYSAIASADLSASQTAALSEGATYFDTAVCDNSGSGGASSTAPTSSASVGTGVPSGGSVYLLGDSITLRSTASYQAALQKNGWTANIDAQAGRSLTTAGTSSENPGTTNLTSGIQAIAADTSQISQAKTVVIALGANGGDTVESINQAINAVKLANSSVPIFWVDTITIGRTATPWAAWDQGEVAPNNRAIYSQSTPDNYKVISWFKAVDPNGDPQNPNGAETDANSYIDTRDGLGVHPTATGQQAISNLVTNTLTTGAGTSTLGATSASCGCSTSPSTSSPTLVGSNNIQQAFNFFVSQGLTGPQAAGAVGNLEQESSVNPLSNQAGGSTQNPNDAGSLGWGIAQWTPGNKVIGIAASENITGPIYELPTQLQIVWGEMTGTSPTGVNNMVTGLKAINDPALAAQYFEAKFEEGDIAYSPPPNGQLLNRQNYATQILQQYGNNASPTTGAAPSGCQRSNSAASCQTSSFSTNTTAPTTNPPPASTTTTNNAAIACDVLQYDPISYDQGAWHTNGSNWHSKCPVINAYCATDCSGLVSIAIYDVYHNDSLWSTYSIVSDTKNFKIIPFSQIQPGDLMEPDSGHVVIIESVQGSKLNTFAANTRGVAQPDQVGPGTYTDGPGNVYIRYVGIGASFSS
jgi:hypothetical protein